MSSIFVFFQVGPQVDIPELFVRSLRKHNPGAIIIQCSDLKSATISGVDEVRRLDGDYANLVAFRLQCFSELAPNEPALYLDSDMVCLRPIEPETLASVHHVAVCKREFATNELFNTSIFGMDLAEYSGRTLGELYPYVGCATATNGPTFWKECLANLMRLDPKFHFFYGDQQVIRDLVQSGRYNVRHLRESIYACLPERLGQSLDKPKLVHFKGQGRKPLMLEWAQRFGL